MSAAPSIADGLYTFAEIAQAWKVGAKQTKRVLKSAKIAAATRDGAVGGPKRFRLDKILASQDVPANRKTLLLNNLPATTPGELDVPAIACERAASRRNTLDGVPLKAIERANARKEIVELSNSLAETDPEL